MAAIEAEIYFRVQV